MGLTARCSVATPFAPSNAPGAIAVIQVRADDAEALDAALDAVGLPGLAPGALTVRRVLDVDECVVARFGACCVHIMPHAGRAVMRAMLSALDHAGIAQETTERPRDRFPEAADEIDACLLDALSRAESPLAVEVLPVHADRWRRGEGAALDDDSAEARALSRLLSAPVVVGWGHANVGKSSLLNALAGRAVSIVADQPGTTRDHVGVTLELDGLAVRWIDAPGVAPGEAAPDDREAMRLASTLAGAADLIVLMGDARRGIAPPPEGYPGPVVRCATRCDLGPVDGARIATSAQTGAGVPELARMVRAVLLPDAALRTPDRWRFGPLPA